MSKSGFTEILMLQIPGISDRRMTITDMQLVRTCQHPLRNGMATGKNHVIGRKIELLDCQRHEWQILTISCTCARQFLDE